MTKNIFSSELLINKLKILSVRYFGHILQIFYPEIPNSLHKV